MFVAPGRYMPLHKLPGVKGLQFELKHNPAGVHYLNPMLLEATNHSAEDLFVVVSPGEIYEPSNPSMQNLIVTRADTFKLPAGGSISKPVAGMCIEPHDAAGNKGTHYTFLKSATDQLKLLSEFIAKKNYQSSAAQQAVWALVDKNPYPDIYSNDTAELMNLNRAMEKIAGIKTRTPEEIKKQNRLYYQPPSYESKYWGEFSFKHNHSSFLKLGLFNKRGIQVRELYNNPSHPSGTSKVAFAFDMGSYTDSTYYLVLVRDDRVISKTELKPYN